MSVARSLPNSDDPFKHLLNTHPFSLSSPPPSPQHTENTSVKAELRIECTPHYLLSLQPPCNIHSPLMSSSMLLSSHTLTPFTPPLHPHRPHPLLSLAYVALFLRSIPSPHHPPPPPLPPNSHSSQHVVPVLPFRGTDDLPPYRRHRHQVVPICDHGAREVGALQGEGPDTAWDCVRVQVFPHCRRRGREPRGAAAAGHAPVCRAWRTVHGRGNGKRVGRPRGARQESGGAWWGRW